VLSSVGTVLIEREEIAYHYMYMLVTINVNDHGNIKQIITFPYYNQQRM
jgi:hypothetical protein